MESNHEAQNQQTLTPKESAPENENPSRQEAEARADFLLSQAETLKKSTGMDMMALFETDADVHQRVASGEWDFADAYQAMNQKEKLPEPVRGGGGSLGEMRIAGMSRGQFERLDEMLAQGMTVRV